MKHFISYELDRFALNFLYPPRSKHPSKEQRIVLPIIILLLIIISFKMR